MQLSYPKIGKGPTMRSLISRAKAVYKRDHPDFVRGYSGGGGHSEERAQIRLESDLEYRAFQKQKDIATFDQNERKMQAKERKQSLDRNKELVYKSIELLNIAKANGNMALQKNIIAQVEGYFYDLDPEMQEFISPIIASGPFSKEASRMRKWDEMNPMPQVDADPDLNPQAYAHQVNDWHTHKSKREGFRTGKAGPIPSILRIDEERFVMTGDNPRIATNDDLKIDEFAKKYGVTSGEVIANGGYRGPNRDVLRDGKKVTYGFNVSLDGNRSLEVRSKTPTKMNNEAMQWAAAFQEWDDLDSDEQKKAANSSIAQAKEIIGKGDDGLREYNDRYFRPRFGANLTIAPDGTTGVIYGEPQILENHRVYMNASGEVFTEYGESLGDYETAVETLRIRLEVAEIQRVEKEREMQARGKAARRGRGGGAFRMMQGQKPKSFGVSGDF